MTHHFVRDAVQLSGTTLCRRCARQYMQGTGAAARTTGIGYVICLDSVIGVVPKGGDRTVDPMRLLG